MPPAAAMVVRTGGSVAEATPEHLVHGVVVLEVIEVHVALEALFHRRAHVLELLFNLVEHVFGVGLDVALEMRAHAGHEQQVAVGDGAREQRRRSSALGPCDAPSWWGRPRPRARPAGRRQGHRCGGRSGRRLQHVSPLASVSRFFIVFLLRQGPGVYIPSRPPTQALPLAFMVIERAAFDTTLTWRNQAVRIDSRCVNGWAQNYDPLGWWPLSTAVSALPVLTLFFFLVVLRKRVWMSALAGLIAAAVLAAGRLPHAGHAGAGLGGPRLPVRDVAHRLDHRGLDVPVQPGLLDRAVPGDEGLHRRAVLGQAAAAHPHRLLLRGLPRGDRRRRRAGGHRRLVPHRARVFLPSRPPPSAWWPTPRRWPGAPWAIPSACSPA